MTLEIGSLARITWPHNAEVVDMGLPVMWSWLRTADPVGMGKLFPTIGSIHQRLVKVLPRETMSQPITVGDYAYTVIQFVTDKLEPIGCPTNYPTMLLRELSGLEQLAMEAK